jgi:hypothetical protein
MTLPGKTPPLVRTPRRTGRGRTLALVAALTAWPATEASGQDRFEVERFDLWPSQRQGALGFSSAAWRVGLHLGYVLRERTELLDLVVDDAVTLGLGAEVTVAQAFRAVAEAFDERPDGSGRVDWTLRPLDGLVAARFPFGDFSLQVGAGAELVGGASTPDYRLLASFGYSPGSDGDLDGDGVVPAHDACPERGGEHDGDADADGCPDFAVGDSGGTGPTSR